jgi:hypothetical protein
LSAVAQRIGIAGGTANEKLAQRGANGAAALGAAFLLGEGEGLTPNNPTDEPDPAPFKVHDESGTPHACAQRAGACVCD